MDLILSVWDLLCICEGQKETVNNICTKKRKKRKRKERASKTIFTSQI
jgi:hypothetical protein